MSNLGATMDDKNWFAGMDNSVLIALIGTIGVVLAFFTKVGSGVRAAVGGWLLRRTQQRKDEWDRMVFMLDRYEARQEQLEASIENGEHDHEKLRARFDLVTDAYTHAQLAEGKNLNIIADLNIEIEELKEEIADLNLRIKACEDKWNKLGVVE